MGKGARLKRERREKATREVEAALRVMTADDALTLVVETGKGTYVRRVPKALPHPPGLQPGTAAEKATHAAAALWGLPDFVFEPALKQKGAGIREIGDGTLLVDRDAVMIQVKHRPAPTDDEEKERRWIENQVVSGIKQANGSIRQLSDGSTNLKNVRGRSIEVKGVDLNWVALVIVDHERAPEGVVVDLAGVAKHPSIVLLRRDWDFLFAQLKSTRAVVDYLKRVSGDEDPPGLGREAVRYYELAAADAAAPPSPVDERFMGPGGFHVSAPLLPQEPAGHGDEQAHAILRMVMEDIATSPMAEGGSEEGRVELLAMIDHMPVAHREALGQTVLEFVEYVSEASPEDVRWKFRRIIGGADRPQLGFAAASRYSREVHAGFRCWVMLRHLDFCRAAGKAEETRTVGVLVTPRPDGLRPWDTTTFFIEGELDLSESDEAALREMWPTPTEAVNG